MLLVSFIPRFGYCSNNSLVTCIFAVNEDIGVDVDMGKFSVNLLIFTNQVYFARGS